MKDMTDLNDTQEDEYGYEYSEFGWTRRLKPTAVTCAPQSESNNVTVGLTTTMTAGHPDPTIIAVSTAHDTCLAQQQSTLTTLSEREPSWATDQIEDSDICTGPPPTDQIEDSDICTGPPPTDTGVEPFCPPVDCSINPTDLLTDTRIVFSTSAVEGDMGHRTPLIESTVDPFIPSASVTSNKNPINSLTNTSMVLHSLPTDCIAPPVHSSMDPTSPCLDIRTDNINSMDPTSTSLHIRTDNINSISTPLDIRTDTINSISTPLDIRTDTINSISTPLDIRTDTINSISTPLDIRTDTINSISTPLDIRTDTINSISTPLDIRTDTINSISTPLDIRTDTINSISTPLDMRTDTINSISTPLDIRTDNINSMDPTSTSLDIRTDSINPYTNNTMNLFSHPIDSNMDPISFTPDTTTVPAIVTHFTDKQDNTVGGDKEKCINCDSLPLIQTTTRVLVEEPQSQCSPDVREHCEVRAICESERWTQMDTRDCGNPEEDSHFEAHTLCQPPEKLAPEEPRGYQEGDTQGGCAVSGDFNTYDVSKRLKGSLTAHRRDSHECEATLEREVLGYCDTHLLMQTAENFMMKAVEISSEGEMMEGSITDGAFVTHPLAHNFQNTVTESHPRSESGNWDQSEAGQSPAPVALGDLADVSTGKEGVTFKPADYDSSNELWLDACQFLAGEENEGSILDEWGHSPSVSSSGEPTHNTKESSFPREAATAVDEPVSGSAFWRPPVERWSSTDSWVSALSDWAPALPAHPEDPFINKSLAEASMAIQDQAAEPKPDGSTQSGQMLTTLPQNLLVLGGHHSTEVRAEVWADSRGQTPDPGLRGCLSTPPQKGTALPSDIGAACDTISGSDALTHPSLSDCSRDMLYGEGCRIQRESLMDLYHKVPSSLQFATKGSGQHYAKQETTPWEVTEVGVSLPVLNIKEEGERSYGSLNISDYSSRSAPAVGREEEGHSKRTPRPATDKGHFTCNLDQTGSLGCTKQENNGSQLPEDKRGFLSQFIMPLAPLYHPCLGNTPQRLTHCSLAGDHLGARGLPKELQTRTNSHGSTHPPVLLPYLQNRLKTHPKLPVVKDIGKHVTRELRAPLDTTDTSTSCDSSSPLNTSSSSDEQAVQADSSFEKCVDQESLCKARVLGKDCTKLLIATGERFAVLEQDRVACLTLDLDYSSYLPQCVGGPKSEKEQIKSANMSHKTLKAALEGKGRFRHKDRSGGPHLTTHASKKQENVHPESQSGSMLADASCEDGVVTVIETIVITEKVSAKAHGKKKKKHHPTTTTGKTEAVPLAEVENGAKQKTTKDKMGSVEPSLHMEGGVKQKAFGAKSKTDTFEAKLAQRSGKGLAKPVTQPKREALLSDISPAQRLLQENAGKPDSKKSDNIRHLTGDKHGVLPSESKQQIPKGSLQPQKGGEVGHKKAYSEVVKERTHTLKQVPQVLEDIQAVPVLNDAQSISLQCQFGTLTASSTVTWTKGGTMLSKNQKGAGDEGQACLTLLKACSKDLGMYRCLLSSLHGSAFSDFHLTSEVLCELLIPTHSTEVEASEVTGDEEDVHCAPLLFRDNFLSEQYFGENQPASIVTEKEHFGEGMHRKAFRATLRAGMASVFTSGHPCVLKVHNSISHGTKNSEELVQRNYGLAVEVRHSSHEECHVQNTAREYIKEYNHVAKASKSFGEVPEIIPIYLVHRPSSDIPYATLEEELMGDFVKYSVKDGKEINLKRRDSEAGQKCCSFQHWVYSTTEGNLLVTDMQGVGMKLTDVGISTCRKGYKGFKGNCAASFIDQFKALHQCNRFCELLGLTSLQPKPKRAAPPAKPKPQPAAKKKTFGPTLKGKS
ncbi:alpha-protein kinase 2 isoform X1 [Clupea harengus]|uniref:non-specific serine/threonine protein kinase n=1 Tax=Clupea harengus TaxID=7950 RepID=A0A6P3WDB4_CLUHA|nr:alpha-protein kinase 2 isoform X1 [Clupea harengus]XP_012695771.2 alpha-protein kinase 2 isoform X1 [Clupea harengus]